MTHTYALPSVRLAPLPLTQSDRQERAFYDSHRNTPVAVTDDDLFDHVRTGAAAPPANKRQPGEPGVTLEQLMRFFDPKLTRKVDDSTEVCGLSHNHGDTS